MASAPRPTWFSHLFGFHEETGSAAAWAATRARFALSPAGLLTSAATGSAWRAGTFSTPSLAELRRAVAAAAPALRRGAAALRHEATPDVLQHHALHPGATFQAASQLNCLEFAGPQALPQDGVTGYAEDRTQGPACALACAAGALARNYFAGNSPSAQVDTLADLGAALAAAGGGGALLVRSGYASAPGGAAGLARLRPLLAEGSASRERLRALVRVGLQRDTEVTFAARFTRPAGGPLLVSQVYASALSLGAYGDAAIPAAAWAPLATLVLEAAYEATLLAALLSSSSSEGAGARPAPTVFLTGLGLGVFGNAPAWVASAIARAVVRVQALGLALDVVFLHFQAVGQGFVAELEAALAAAARSSAAEAPAAHAPAAAQ